MHAEHANRPRLDDLSRLVIGCVFAVLNSLGCGFAEKIYENALVLELQAAGLTAEPQFVMPVIYRDTIVGQYVADILVEGMLLIELKSVTTLADLHRHQCTNYLKVSGLRLCLRFNFGNPRLEIKRVVNGL